MNKKIAYLGLLFLILGAILPRSVYAERAEYLYVLKEDFIDSYKVLVARTAPLYKDELWVVEYGIGCLSMWRFEEKNIIATYSSFLDGIGGELTLPQSGSCRIWDADALEDIDKEDLREEDWEWLRDNGFIRGLSSSAYTPTPSTITCPGNSVSQSGQCV